MTEDPNQPTAPNQRTFTLNSQEFYEAIRAPEERPWIPNGALPREPRIRDRPPIMESRNQPLSPPSSGRGRDPSSSSEGEGWNLGTFVPFCARMAPAFAREAARQRGNLPGPFSLCGSAERSAADAKRRRSSAKRCVTQDDRRVRRVISGGTPWTSVRDGFFLKGCLFALLSCFSCSLLAPKCRDPNVVLPNTDFILGLTRGLGEGLFIEAYKKFCRQHRRTAKKGATTNLERRESPRSSRWTT